jgi:hypothetical protein
MMKRESGQAADSAHDERMREARPDPSPRRWERRSNPLSAQASNGGDQLGASRTVAFPPRPARSFPGTAGWNNRRGKGKRNPKGVSG